VIVGASDSLFQKGEAFRYSTYSGMTALDESNPVWGAIGISADGNAIIGRDYRYTLSEGIVMLPFEPHSTVTAISADGRVIVGYLPAITVDGVKNEPFRYTSSEGQVRLGAGFSLNEFGASAYGVSGDGKVIVGYDDVQDFTFGIRGFRYTESSGMVSLGQLNIQDPFPVTFAESVSSDGSVIVGMSRSENSADTPLSPHVPGEAFRHTRFEGMVGLGDLPGGEFHSRAIDVSSDGRVIIGFGHSAKGKESFVWDADSNAMRSLFDALVADGLDLSEWSELKANAISDDGSTIVGSGTHNGKREAFAARIAFEGWIVSYEAEGGFSSLSASGYSIDSLRFGDFDGDGKTDVFVSNNGQWFVSYGGKSAWTSLAGASYSIDSLRFGDFDGDGKTDVFVSNNGQWYVSYGGTSNWAPLAGAGYSIDRLRFGDFDGDGKTDVFVSNNGQWFVSYGGTSNWAPLAGSSYSINNLRFGDFDGDGKTDVFAVTSSGLWSVSYGGISNWTPLAGPGGYSIDRLRFGDFDGDGKTDVLAVSNNGQWSVSFGGISIWNRRQQTPGYSIDSLRFGDFDGSGTTDVFVKSSGG
jgi:uncharacterized membrane protein